MKKIIIIPIVSIAVLLVFGFSFFSVESVEVKCKALIIEQMEFITKGYNPDEDLERATEIDEIIEKVDCEKYITKQELQDLMIEMGIATP